ncbi:hypothetical protein [Vulgatibacter incomptus]|uniref:Uncharacterized protein n=1 Tax=Vulgatibacter incomptus TaxID=1391653 RepID=A0A0K1PIE1_9BACT|nr:hypothetical protein [Vulgatibacter incomptus]AKU93181.1 hypothetical protein AKJ08_3568 [Vulgatibacter incomptus]
MPTPPPLPFDRESLRRELQALDTPELLALGARMRRDPSRLSLYLGILRARPGHKAQLAACLICFDLARLGQASAERDFHALIPTLRGLAGDPLLLTEMIGDDPFLLGLWGACRQAIDADDPRESTAGLEANVPLVGELDLLSDLELDLDLSRLADAARREENGRAFAKLTARQLGYDLENDRMPEWSGMSTSTGREVDALEEYLRQASTYAPSVPLARGLSSVGQLFLASHLRRRSLFGKPNHRRIEALRAGLSALPSDRPDSLATAAGLFEEEGEAVIERFQKVSELLLDYVRFCSIREADPLHPGAVEAYIEADRLPAPLFLAGETRRRR